MAGNSTNRCVVARVLSADERLGKIGRVSASIYRVLQTPRLGPVEKLQRPKEEERSDHPNPVFLLLEVEIFYRQVFGAGRLNNQP